jgi:hypothetical protein
VKLRAMPEQDARRDQETEGDQLAEHPPKAGDVFCVGQRGRSGLDEDPVDIATAPNNAA